jgi:hypothetical protein
MNMETAVEVNSVETYVTILDLWIQRQYVPPKRLQS